MQRVWLCLAAFAAVTGPAAAGLTLAVVNTDDINTVMLQPGTTLGMLLQQLQDVGQTPVHYASSGFQDVNTLRQYDFIITHGRAALEVADFAAAARVPVVRFVASESQLQPALERPALIALDAANHPRCNPADEASGGESQDHSCPAPEGWKLMPDIPRILLSGDSGAAALLARLQAMKSATSADQVDELATVRGALGLVMIVKDEARTITETLHSVKDDVDYWTVVDTGSSDNTAKVAAAALDGLVPGQLLEQPFADFAASRNWALAAHGNATAYALMVDADFAIRHGWRLRLACQRLVLQCRQRVVDDCSRAMTITNQYGGGNSKMWARVFPAEGLGTQEGWHYVYPVHEVPTNLKLGHLQGADIIQLPWVVEEYLPSAGEASVEKSRKRWRDFDLPVLEKERAAKPQDARIAFYYAQTLWQLGDAEAAHEAYEQRLSLGGWREELFDSALKQAQILVALGRDPVPKFKQAAAISPHRAEPLYGIGSYYADAVKECGGEDPLCQSERHLLAYFWAHKAAVLPLPTQDVLFVDSNVYTHQALDLLATHAWYVAKELGDAFVAGYTASQEVARRLPNDERIATNFAWWKKLEQARIEANTRAHPAAAQ